MKYQFKGFYHVAPRKQSLNGDGSFVYSVVLFMLDTETNNVIQDYAEIAVPGTTTNSDTDPFIMSQLMMRISAMWNKVN